MLFTEHFFATIIMLVLVGLAGYFGWRQWQVLGRLRNQDLPVEDQRYLRRQAWRRLIGCGLMIVLAGLFVAWYWFGLNQQATDLAEQGKLGRPLNPEQLRQAYGLLTYVAVAVLILVAMLCLAALDLLAIRRFGLRQYRQIQEDRRAMIEDQACRLRSQRNGHV